MHQRASDRATRQDSPPESSPGRLRSLASAMPDGFEHLVDASLSHCTLECH